MTSVADGSRASVTNANNSRDSTTPCQLNGTRQKVSTQAASNGTCDVVANGNVIGSAATWNGISGSTVGVVRVPMTESSAQSEQTSQERPRPAEKVAAPVLVKTVCNGKLHDYCSRPSEQPCEAGGLQVANGHYTSTLTSHGKVGDVERKKQIELRMRQLRLLDTRVARSGSWPTSWTRRSCHVTRCVPR